MERRLLYPLMIILALAAGACKKNDFNYPPGTVGSSKITYYPVLTQNGARYVVLAVGQPYTEEGVTAKEGDQEIDVNITGSVNTAVPGIYTLTYTAVNKDGFPASVYRTVVIQNTTPDAAAHDLSGTYARTSNGVESVWTKIGPGVYTVFNPGGAAGTNLTVVVLNPTGYTINIPEQVSSDGSISSSSNESYNAATGTYTWVFINPTYGSAPRTFVKQ